MIALRAATAALVSAPGEESTLWQMNLTEFNQYFEARALEKLPPPEPWPPVKDGPVPFERHLLNPPGAAQQMSSHGFGRAYGQFIGMLSKDSLHRLVL